jgi:methyltransferase
MVNHLSIGQAAFVSLVFAVVLQRLLELRVSRRNEAALRVRGAIEHAPQQMPWMIFVHSAWLVAMLVEVFVFQRPFFWALALPSLGLFAVGQTLRMAAMRALGPRWTVKVLTLPGEPPVTRGIYRWLRHPNYLGVILEILALPLFHSAWVTALTFSAANALLLIYRIKDEERALRSDNAYDDHFHDRSRLIPGR